ncbi:acetyl-CoA carboxylase carboxyltransferase subunit alpha [soil metagenome]
MENTENSAFARIQRARHPERPYTNDLLKMIFSDFTELHGDRRYSDDAAIVCGFAGLERYVVAVIGQQKGRDTNQRRFRNFGMPKPEGYRKALRIMRLAEKFGRPVITFIDTPGAYPGIDAEERGQAEAIAYNLREMSGLKVPTVAVVLGEGGSGGALAIAVSDRVLMMENSVYSVISPEGCAAILWKDSEKSADAAECLKLTADNLENVGLIDQIIPEGVESWAFASDNENSQDLNPTDTENNQTYTNIKRILLETLDELTALKTADLLDSRYQKFRKMGVWK